MVELTQILQDPPSVATGELMTTIPGSEPDTATTDDSSSMSRKMVTMALDQGRDFVLNKLDVAPELAKYAVTQFATAELLQLVGIGAGFTSLNMTGFALAQISKKLDEIKADVKTILGAPAIEALQHLKRGMRHLEARDYSLANGDFNKVIDLAIRAGVYQKENLPTLAKLTEYMVFADIMISSYDKKDEIFVPYELLKDTKKSLIRDKVGDLLKYLLDAQKEQKISFFQLPGAKKEKKGLNQNLVDGVLRHSLQFLCPPGSPIPIKFIPDGAEDAALVNLDGKPGRLDDSAVNIFRIGEKVIVRHYLTGKVAEIYHKNESDLMIKSTSTGVLRDGHPLEIAYNTDQDQEFLEASEEGKVSEVQAMLMGGTDINKQNESNLSTALMLAITGGKMEGRIEVVTVLVQQPTIDLNIKNMFGITALMYASMKGESEVVAILVQQPAIDINIKDNEGNTALMLTSRTPNVKGSSEVVAVLVKQPTTDINIQNERGNTALMYAIESGLSEAVAILVQQPATNLNIKSNIGRTALHFTAMGAPSGVSVTIAKELVKAGSDITVEDEDGKTAAELAKVSKYKRMIDVFDYLSTL